MEPSAGSETAGVRLLGLGNELLADDAFGWLVARQAAERMPELEVVCSSESGLALLDHLTGVRRLIIADTIQTGNSPPGTIHVFDVQELRGAPARSPHGAGLWEALELARGLGLGAPEEILVLAVEAADCSTVGGAMHPAVEAAIPPAVEWIGAAAGLLTRPVSASPG